MPVLERSRTCACTRMLNVTGSTFTTPSQAMRHAGPPPQPVASVTALHADRPVSSSLTITATQHIESQRAAWRSGYSSLPSHDSSLTSSRRRGRPKLRAAASPSSASRRKPIRGLVYSAWAALLVATTCTYRYRTPACSMQIAQTDSHAACVDVWSLRRSLSKWGSTSLAACQGARHVELSLIHI